MKTRPYPTLDNPTKTVMIEAIPYRESITTASHVLCCCYKKDIECDKPALHALTSEGWRIYGESSNTLNNIARMMIENTRFSEKTLSELDIWNLFVPIGVYDSYGKLLKTSGKNPEDFKI